jgi:predicted phage tail protein
MLRKIYLHGFLAEKYGHCWELDVCDPHGALQALTILTNDQFALDLRDAEHEHGTQFRIVSAPADRPFEDVESNIQHAPQTMGLKTEGDYHIIPVLKGASTGTSSSTNWWMVIGGAVLMYFGFYQIGMALILSGVMSLINTPKKNTLAQMEQNKYINSIDNVSSMDGIWGIAFGLVLVGSRVMSSDVLTRETSTANPYGNVVTTGGSTIQYMQG